MAAENTYTFEGFSEDNLLWEETDFGIDAQSDISFSSVNTSDLSDFSELEDDDEIFTEPDEWSENVVEPTRPSEFTSFVGPTHPLGLDATPFEYFCQLFPLNLFEEIAFQTNLYARQKNAVNFIPTCAAEIRAYIGILFRMGVIHLPNYRCYWSKDDDLRISSIAKIMPRNRYDELTRYFHLNDSSTNPPSTSPQHDKLHKIRPVIQNAKRQFRYHYEPHKTLSIDEGMIKFTGRNSFLQYMPNKPTKWGFKAWGIADSDSYYLLDFDIYTGKDSYPDRTVPLGTYVVTELARNYYGKNHHIYFDNFFTSVPLMEDLFKEKTYACGTIRRNRQGLPYAFKHSKLTNTGEMKKFQKGKLTAITWCENRRQVNLLTTANTIKNRTVTRKRKGGGADLTYEKPIAVIEYTNNFNGLDKNDQLRHYYKIATKARKWWKYLFWFILDVSAINAYILYTEAPGGPRQRRISRMDFQRAVAKGLINGHTSRKRKAATGVPSPILKKPVQHQPTRIETTRGKRVCVVCAKGTKRTANGNKIQSSWECKRCGVTLCKDNGCFGQFHNFQQ